MEVTIKLDRTTGRAQFALLVNALLAAGALVQVDENLEAATPAAPVVPLLVKAAPKKNAPPVTTEVKSEAATVPATEEKAEAGEKIRLFTDEDVRAKCAELKAAGKMAKVKELILAHNGTSATGVEDRTAFMAALNAL